MKGLDFAASRVGCEYFRLEGTSAVSSSQHISWKYLQKKKKKSIGMQLCCDTTGAGVRQTVWNLLKYKFFLHTVQRGNASGWCTSTDMTTIPNSWANSVIGESQVREIF